MNASLSNRFITTIRPLASKLGGFAANSVITGAAGVLTIPLVISLFGPETWGRYAIGQSVGLFSSVVVGFGWAVIGPSHIAGLDPSSRRAEFRVSVLVRLILLLATSLLIALLSALGTLPGGMVTVPIAIAYSATGLSSLWYFVGAGEPRPALLRDALPRALATLLAPLAGLLTNPLIGMGVLTLIGQLVSLILCARVILRKLPEVQDVQLSKSMVVDSLKIQRDGFASAVISSAYLNLPVTFLGIINPSAVPVYALGDRVVKYASAAARPLTQVVQGWVPKARGTELNERIRRAVRIMFAVGVVACLTLVVLGSWIAEVLSRGQLELGLSISCAMGISLGSTLISQSSGLGCLGALGRYQTIVRSAIIGAVSWAALFFLGVPFFGAAGAMWSVAIAEFLVVIWQIADIRRSIKGRG